VAFLVLVYAPFLQRITSTGLLILQLLRLAAGPASLANLAAAVLSFMLMDDDLWVPVLLRAAKAMRVGPVRSNVSTEQLQDHAGGSDVLTRQNSAYSEDGELLLARCCLQARWAWLNVPVALRNGLTLAEVRQDWQVRQ
jgi:hypothetical protein